MNSRNVDWRVYGGEMASPYSTLDRINTRNVAELKQVWQFGAGTVGLQTSPLVVGRTLYAYPTNQNVIALDLRCQATGQPARGLSWWSEGKERRVFAGG